MNIRMQSIVNRLRLDERGLTTVEYVIVLCLIAAVAVTTWAEFGNKIRVRLEGADEAVGTIPETFLDDNGD